MSSPRSVTGKVFATDSALNTISKSASPSECIILIPKADHWVPSISRNVFWLYFCRRKSLDYGGMVLFIFLAFLYFGWYVYCPCRKNQITSIKYDLCFPLYYSCSAKSVWRIDIFHQMCLQESLEVFSTMTPHQKQWVSWKISAIYTEGILADPIDNSLIHSIDTSCQTMSLALCKTHNQKHHWFFLLEWKQLIFGRTTKDQPLLCYSSIQTEALVFMIMAMSFFQNL